jgi:hypothetical protein
MKTETLIIPANQVKSGDMTPYGVATTDAVSEFTGTVGFNIGPAILTLSEDHRITISRPVADPCPRGRMTATPSGVLLIGDCQTFGERWKAAARRIVALWNEAESAEPYRTTEEIEAANAKGTT